ncbi:DUF5753 domain-containing protein [Streptomyces sp. NPDC048057]|uniref:DUF5753 domain-containing protein n=1 Tax=Streptomyces sp. NPDC048057 TaxID=3155628 RepID=UPI0033C6CF9C
MAKDMDTPSMAELYGGRLRRLRQGRGWTQRELGAMIPVEHSRIAQIERATGAKPTLQLSRAFDRIFDTDRLFEELWPYVHAEAYPNWSRAYLRAQARALEVRAYTAHSVHGLLQTQEYARAMLSVGRTLKTPEQLEERVAARLARQERVFAQHGPHLWVVLDEAVLHRPIGGQDVMRTQLAALLAAAERPNITLQVLPYSEGAHEAMGGSLDVLDMPDGTVLAYREGSDFGWLVEEPEEVKYYSLLYDRLRAQALPPFMSLDMIRSYMEDSSARVPAQPQRRRLAQVQLQQPGGWELRRNRGRTPRRPGPGQQA